MAAGTAGESVTFDKANLFINKRDFVWAIPSESIERGRTGIFQDKGRKYMFTARQMNYF